jgi:hypothetical protein
MKFNEAINNYLNSTNNARINAKNTIIDFFYSTPNRSLNQLNQIAEENTLGEDINVENLVFEIVDDYIKFLKGGRWNENGMQSVDENELKLGIIIESEHTSNLDDIKRIALDHLTEIPDYYSRLINMKLEAGVEIDPRIQLNVKNKVGPKTVLKRIN